jgi:hypothetical protein
MYLIFLRLTFVCDSRYLQDRCIPPGSDGGIVRGLHLDMLDDVVAILIHWKSLIPHFVSVRVSSDLVKECKILQDHLRYCL